MKDALRRGNDARCDTTFVSFFRIVRHIWKCTSNGANGAYGINDAWFKNDASFCYFIVYHFFFKIKTNIQQWLNVLYIILYNDTITISTNLQQTFN